jgi:hypothetical protein
MPRPFSRCGTANARSVWIMPGGVVAIGQRVWQSVIMKTPGSHRKSSHACETPVRTRSRLLGLGIALLAIHACKHYKWVEGTLADRRRLVAVENSVSGSMPCSAGGRINRLPDMSTCPDSEVSIMKFAHLSKSWFRRASRLRRRHPHVGYRCVAAEILEYRQLLSAAAPGVTMTVQGSSITLASTDINNPSILVVRNGNNVVVTGANGTLITLGSSVASSQSVAISSVNNLTVNLGTGNNTVSIVGLSTTGNITLNGKSTGITNISISAGSPNVVIGGSVQANLGGESGTFNLFGSGNGGGSLTVNGSVIVTEGGAGNKQINFAGPPAGNPNGGKTFINGSITVVDTGNGQSGLRIDDGVTIGGNVLFDNSVNTVGGDNVQMYSNSNAFGTTSIAGTLTLALSRSAFQDNFVEVHGFGTPLTVTGAVDINSGGGNDTIELLNDFFKSTVNVDTGTSPSFSKDRVIIDGSRFDVATTISMSGPYSEFDLGTNSLLGPTTFNSSLTALLTGPSAAMFLSNSTSTVNQVVFNSTVSLTGGTPFGTLVVQGRFSVNPANFTKTNFNTASTVPAVVANVTVTSQGSDVTLTSTDINNPNITVTRSGGNVAITGLSGTQITLGSNVATTQLLPIANVNNLTVKLGTGADTVAISGLSVSGNVTINGQAGGMANISIFAGTPNATIGGSIQGNLAGEAVTMNVFGSFQGGGNLTVTGSINVAEGGAGAKQVNIFGPPGSPFIVTDYTNARGRPTHVVQNGTNRLIFVDGLGNFLLGTFISPNQALADSFPGDFVTFGGNALTWADGSVWTRSNPSTQVVVTDFTNQKGRATHLISDGTNNLVFIDGVGNFSLGNFINSTQALAQLYPGDVATFNGNTINWGDGTVWTQGLSNLTGGKLIVNGGVGVVDSGSGQSGFHIDDGVTIKGNVSYDNSANTVGASFAQIYSNSNFYGVTTIGGTLTLSLSQSVYRGDFVELQGFGSSLAVTGVVNITSGAGADTIHFANDDFKNTINLDTGASPSFNNDLTIVDGTLFEAAATFNGTGPFVQLNLGANPLFGPTTFKSSLRASLTGPSALVLLSNATSSGNEVVFNSTAAFIGGTPFGTIVIQGNFFGNLTKTNFN